MKKMAVLPAIVLLLTVSCEKKTTTTYTDGGKTTVETVGFDKQRIDSTATKVKRSVNHAADKTGEALETAGEKIKEGTKKAEAGLKKATDGDGNPKK